MNGKTALFELLSLAREAEALIDELDSGVLSEERLKEIRKQKDRVNARLKNLS